MQRFLIAQPKLWIHRLAARRCRRDRGAGLVEYGLLIALIALICFAAVSFFGGETSGSFSNTADSIANL